MRLSVIATAITLALTGLTHGQGAAAAVRKPINIPAGALGSALNTLARERDLQVVYRSEIVGDQHTPGAAGDLTLDEALGALLNNTGLTYKYLDDKAVTIVPAATAPAKEEKKSFVDRLRLAQVEAQAEGVSAARESQVSPDALEEVVVTAGKRDERLQDTAMSLSVLGSRDIERQGLTGMADYLRAVPGASFLDQGVGRNATIIRGISTAPQSDGITNGQTVGVYFGEVPLSGLRWSPADIKLVDMERVEVLRGPQGTLYGSSSLSGAVRNIPNAPDLHDFDGWIAAGYADTARNGGGGNEQKAVVNIPLVDSQLAVRAVGYRFDVPGYVRNTAGNDPAFVSAAASWGAGNLARNQTDIGQATTTGGRIAARWLPVEGFEATLTFLTQNAVQDGLPEVELNKGGYTQERLLIGDVLGGGGERLSDRTTVSNLVLNYELPWATLVSSSSYSEQEFGRYYGIGAFWGDGRPVPQYYQTQSSGFSEEVRLVSRLSGPLQFVGGLYYEDLKLAELGRSAFAGTPGLNPFSELTVYEFLNRTKLRQRAAFGEVSYDVLSQLKVTLGARRFDYDRTLAATDGGAFGGSSSGASSSEGKTSHKANVTYTPARGSMLYAQWSQGFRVGRPLTPYPSTCDDNLDGFVDGYGGQVPIVGSSLRSDSLDSYELGGKFSRFDNRLVVNASVYRIQWKDLPVSVPGPSTCLLPIYLNAGKARSRGAEIESWFQATSTLRLNLTASFVDVELDGDAAGIGQDGDRLPGSPKEQFSAGVQYNFLAQSVPAYIRGDYLYVGSFYSLPGEQGVETGGYGQVNLKVGASLRQTDIALYANNLTNSDATLWADTVFPDTRAFRLRPRTIGIEATLRFK